MDTGEIEDESPVTGRVRPCPGCGLTDRTVAVPAAYRAGRDSVLQVTGAGDGQRLRAADSPLTTALAPAPEPGAAGLACLGVFALLITVVLLFVGGAIGPGGVTRTEESPASGTGSLITGGWPEDASDDAWDESDGGGEDTVEAVPLWIAGVTATGAAVFLVLTVRKRRESARVERGRRAAERIWEQGWYCERCGTVHLREAGGPEDGPLPLTEFRRRVWGAGGYGDLVDRYATD